MHMDLFLCVCGGGGGGGGGGRYKIVGINILSTFFSLCVFGGEGKRVLV